MEISSINFVSKSLVFPERCRRSLPIPPTSWCLQGLKSGNVPSKIRAVFLREWAAMLIINARASLRTFQNSLSVKRLSDLIG
jgi:hypothetical protein